MAPKCTAKSKQTGERCKQYAARGTNVCRFHGGKAPQVKKAAEVRAARIHAEGEAQRMLARAGVDADPIEHLLESLHRAAALVEVWAAMVSEIDVKAEEESKDRDFIRGELGYEEIESDKGFTDTVVSPRDRLMAVNSRGDSVIHPYMTEYQSALDRRAKFAKLCIDAGVAERTVKLAEQQVEIAYGAFEASILAAGMTDDQKQKARRAYASNLRAQ